MKVLIITTNNYPYNGTCSNIIHNLLFDGKLKEKFTKVDILCSKSNVLEPDYETIDGINIYRVLSWTLINKDKFIDNLIKKKTQIIKGFFSRLINYFFKKIVKSNFIDLPTYFSFKKAIKRLDTKYDIIITISGRYDATKAVLDYVKSNNQKLIFYQVDPCSTNMSYSKQSINNRDKFEYDLYKRANFIITTPIVYNEHKKDIKYHSFFSKIWSLEFPVVIPNSEIILSKDNEKEKTINCMFLGSLYGGARNPDYALTIFSKIKNPNIKLHLIGATKENISPNLISNNFIFYGRKSIDECKIMMKNADFLVNIGNTVMNQVPSKIFDYISTGKPIINICESEKCPSIDYMNNYPEAINIIKNNKDISKQVDDVESFLCQKHNHVSNAIIHQNFLKCTPEYCSNQIYNIIQKEINEEETKI